MCIDDFAQENSRKWCRRHGVEEQRLYEISKLRQQFKELLQDAKLLALDEGETTINIYGMKVKDKSLQYRKQELKKLQKERDKHRKRRVLQLEEDDITVKEATEKEEESWEEFDLRDVDFKLSHTLQDIHHSSATLSKHDLNVIKIILCSGLYPNLALPDEHNANHKESDQVYHTPFKQFTSIHPTSIFYGRSMFIPAHDMLCYEKLLETNKPYITNAFRIPALQTLLLCANSSTLENMI